MTKNIKEFNLCRYYDIDSIYEIINGTKYMKLSLDDENVLIDNKFVITKITDEVLNYIPPLFEYYNIQIYKKCIIYNIDNVDIIFSEYEEDGVTYYDIWTKTSYPDKFMDIVATL
jgi:NRPS condensation-like uncharacterized protein